MNKTEKLDVEYTCVIQNKILRMGVQIVTSKFTTESAHHLIAVAPARRQECRVNCVRSLGVLPLVHGSKHKQCVDVY
jgi:hypothetical protein